MDLKFPKKVKITARSSSITNSFVSSIIPYIKPSQAEVKKVLEILNINFNIITCAYCGDNATEWDHFRPIVKDLKPTGYISEIRNFVPACGKCNQSKGNKSWKEWILSSAKKSPKSRSVKSLNEKIKRLEKYKKWGKVKLINFEKIIGKKMWDKHWEHCEKIHRKMNNYQPLADMISEKVISYLLKKNLI